MDEVDPGGLRIGDAEREAAMAQLQRHFRDGRLSIDELDDRLSTVASARTVDDLTPILADLPRLPARPVPTPIVADEPLVPSATPPSGLPLRSFRTVLPAMTPFLTAIFVTTVVWALSGGGYFWPAWVYLGCSVPLIGILVAWYANSGD